MKFLKNDKIIDSKFILHKTRISLLYVLFFMFALNGMAEISYSQMVRLSMNIEKPSLKDAIVEIKNQTEFDFIYSKDIEPLYKAISQVVVENGTIEEVLDKLFINSLIEYKIVDKTIVLMPEINITENTNTVRQSVQQNISISGAVTDDAGESLIGVNVQVKGTTIGVITDINGKFTIQVPNRQSVLVFSYIGFLSQEINVGSQSDITVRLREDIGQLEEVVVIGYGVQKKKLITGSTLQVSGDNIQKMSTTNAFTALQSQSPGVTIMQNNGQPGSGYIINIRGLGTNGEARPLYVVDGVVSGFDALNHMSTADIESIDILKDAASTAIYGARAANGVILVTTKQGQTGKTRITYDGYYGQQYLFRKPKVLNARQYMDVMDEQRIGDSLAPFDWEKQIGSRLYNEIQSGRWNGTDWIDEFYIPGAATQTHAFNLTGGNDVSKFSIGYSYTAQDGILGEAVQSHYDRNTFRINSDHVLLKVKGFDAIKIGQTLNYIYRTQNGISTGNQYSNDFSNMLRGVPLMPAYNEDGSYYALADKQRDGWDFWGNFGNPIALAALSSRGLNLRKNHNLNASVYLQIQPVKNLIFKSQYSYRMNAESFRSQDRIRQLSLHTSGNVTVETVNQTQRVGINWSLENTLSYNREINRHRFDIVIGQSVDRSGLGESIRAQGNRNIFDLGWDYAWVSNTKPTALDDKIIEGRPLTEEAISSFFGRVNYNYKETYMATLIMRADASSNFARGNRWGYFPSVSAGWIITNEPFMESLRDKMDYFKLRTSWGHNGNSAVNGFQYLTTFTFPTTASYYFGTDKSTPSVGSIPGVLKNPDISWEKTEMIDIGFDANFLRSRLGVNFSYYQKHTKDWLLRTPIVGTWGYSAPNANGGSVRNRGLELAFTWNDRISDFTYSFNINGSWNKNEVLTIENDQGWIEASSNVLSQGSPAIARLQVGHPMGFFYMYKTDGIFQTQSEIDAYVSKDGNLIMPAAIPGDVRFVDTNGDGKIDTEDRVEVGCGWPVYQLGFSVNMAYKGFDFMLTGTGKFGHHIAKSYRSFIDMPYENYTTQVYERWTGPGTSNKWPRLTNGSYSNYSRVSDLFIEKADHVKIQNITLGYDFKKLFRQLPFAQLRTYITGQNMFYITKYSGIDPEVGFGDGNNWVTGYDLGMYPSTRTFLFGVQVTF